jgi:hypothetical protein
VWQTSHTALDLAAREGRGAQAWGILWKTPIHAMARYANSYEDRLRREIRDAIAIDPIASIAQITERLNKRLNHSFDPRYIKKLRDQSEPPAHHRERPREP